MSGPVGIFFFTEELMRLAGVPHLAYRLYIELRRLMDFTSFKVGARYPHTSWKALAECCYIEPHPGLVDSGEPTLQQMRGANGWLIRRGLVQMQSNSNQWHLIFFLPVARQGFFARNKANTNPTGQPNRGLRRGKPSYLNTDEGAQPNKQRSTESIHHHDDMTVGASQWTHPVDNLIHSPTSSATEKAQFTLMLQHARINGQAQDLLDEFAGAAEQGAIRKNRMGFFNALIVRAEAGSFELDKGTAIAAKRARATQEAAKAVIAPPPEARASKEAREATMAAVRSMKGRYQT